MKVRERAQGRNPEAGSNAEAVKKRLLTGLGSSWLAHFIPFRATWPGMICLTMAEALPQKSLVKKILFKKKQ